MPEQLWQTTLNPATRTLRKLTIEDAGGCCSAARCAEHALARCGAATRALRKLTAEGAGGRVASQPHPLPCLLQPRPPTCLPC